MSEIKSAKALGITAEEKAALVKVEALLISGAVKHGDWDIRKQAALSKFNMAVTGCGSAGCIGGWMSCLMQGAKPDARGVYRGFDKSIVDDYVHNDKSPSLEPLFFPSGGCHSGIGTTRAAAAIRSFLQTGKPDWNAA